MSEPRRNKAQDLVPGWAYVVDGPIRGSERTSEVVVVTHGAGEYSL